MTISSLLMFIIDLVGSIWTWKASVMHRFWYEMCVDLNLFGSLGFVICSLSLCGDSFVTLAA